MLSKSLLPTINKSLMIDDDDDDDDDDDGDDDDDDCMTFCYMIAFGMLKLFSLCDTKEPKH